MIAKILAATLVVTSLPPAAIAEPLGEHPAVLVARTWNRYAIDPNTYIFPHPAGLRWILNPPPTAKDKATLDPAPHAAKTKIASPEGESTK